MRFPRSSWIFVLSLSLLWALPLRPTTAVQPWKTLTRCQLLSSPSNDGDSFHVRHEGKEYIFRLYFVDAPETDNDFADRVTEQASYFHISHADAIQVGKIAAKFTATQLQREFTVITREQDAMGRSHRPRYYAFVLVSGKQDLGELLVQNGLGRIHGEHATLTGSFTTKEEVAKLERFEAKARQQRRGAWASPPGSNVNLTDPSKPSGDYCLSPVGERHNSRCRLFNVPFNKPCNADEGKPCRFCGG